jgi:ATP-dependent helicase/nuclease subunit B
VPEIAALWWPRFERVARWFLGWQAERAALVSETLTEQGGRLEWATSAGRIFTLTGRADRLDRMRDGGWSIVDYKTGSPPPAKEVTDGFASQLPLEGAMLLDGGLGTADAGDCLAELLYVQLSGGSPPGLARDALPKARKGEAQQTAEELARASMEALRRVIDRFEEENQPYLSSTAPKGDGRFEGDYDHLARVKEWSRSGGLPDEEKPES